MELLILSFLPFLALIIFAKTAPRNIKKILTVLSIPFFLILAAYSILIFCAILISFLLFNKIIKYFGKKSNGLSIR